MTDLKSIMQFIYTGEVNVTEEDLPGLLEVAEMLGVRGLKSGGNDDKENTADDDNDDDSKNSSLISQPEPSQEATEAAEPTSEAVEEFAELLPGGGQVTELLLSRERSTTTNIPNGEAESPNLPYFPP